MPAARSRPRVAALLGAAHPGPALAVTVGCAGLALAVGLGPGRLALVVAAVLTGQLSIGWSNDLVDLERDRQTGRSDKPLTRDPGTARAARAACGAAVVATVLLSLACGWLAGLVHLVCVAAGWAYNLGLKSGVWSWLPYAVAFGGLPVFVSLAGGDLPPWWAPVVGALLGVGAHLLNVLPDLADDAATGVHGLPHRLGARRTPPVAVGLLVTASLLVAAAAPSPLRWILVVVAAALAVAALTTHGRTPFRAAIAIALVDVVALVWVL